MVGLDRAAFRARVSSGEPVMVQWCPDALTARLCERLGYDGGYLGGGGLGYSMAISEALLSVSDLAAASWQIRRRSRLPLIVDGGVGFGDAIHVARTVWELEAAGVHAIELEDQVAPKRASHHRHVEHLIPLEEMVAKIRFAAQARRDPDLLLIARTGAVQNEDFERAVERLAAYHEAGADVVMLLPANDEQLAEAPARLSAPVATLTSFDLHTAEEWRSLGYAILIDAVTGQTAAFAALREAYELQHSGKPSGRPAAESFAIYESFQELAGFEELYDIERATTEPGT
ncbi:isocitrate lyase/phosphoenolpyruvate mutase family protein [Amycolatopsis sp. SID8362]|uniref:isocitrate lyase/PEP mutase family protein n=1 Tax=Amycolatopsis sp. SID8362 TaxID=2690346 RepID=UPI001367FC88|nr:isocitrate lyase/phosphoenolpyruvate mutase family protein [Amycolatopsis sp. SID8362]NBH07411.1 carboxyvinyl-carboxyphosphonate phosphorylmutase [Amycolatopsis sp. SID8362]NED44107.1 carboxyvinyl-carboxyphosphonate phosphorylmutase [Amycolatopsis sp. SID8362]